MTEIEPPYTPPEAAKLLRIGTDKVYELVAAGVIAKLPGMGRKILIARATIRAYLGETPSQASN